MFTVIVTYLRSLWQRPRVAREADDELRHHLEMEIAANVARGMAPEEARRVAYRDFGGVEQTKEAIRDVRTIRLDSVWHDTLYALRTLGHARGFTAVAVVSLALGIGANTAIFSILNSLLLKPLPVREPFRLVSLGSDQPGEDAAMSYRIWSEVRDRRLLDDAFVWASDRLIFKNGVDSMPLETIWASGGFFNALGVQTIAGRTLSDADDRPGGGADGPVAVVSYGLSQRLFGGAMTALGRTLTVDGVGFKVVGVAPRNFFGPNVGSSFDIVLPLETEPLLRRVPSRLGTWPWLHITARLRAGSTLDAVTAAMRAAQPLIRDATLPTSGRPEDRDAYLRKPWTMRSAANGSSSLRSRYGAALGALLAMVGLVLLVACANVGHLLLARTTARRYEFSVRAALGASRLRLVQQLMVESLLISAFGAALGFALAQWGSQVIVSQLSTWASVAFLDVSPDWRVLGVTAAVTLLTTVLFGTVPALRVARATPNEAINRSRTANVSAKLRTGGALVTVQLALSLLLLVGAALFLKSFLDLVHRDLGFDRDRVLIVVVDVRRSAIPVAQRVDLYERLRLAAGTAPGAESAATSMATPLGSAGIRLTPTVSVPDNPQAQGVRILTNLVSADWFRTFGTRLAAGRDFSSRDQATSSAVVIVNETFVKRYLNSSGPLGRTVVVAGLTTEQRSLEIIGVVQDAAFTSVREPAAAMMYRPLSQAASPDLLRAAPTISLSVRSTGDVPPARLTGGVVAAIAGVDRDVSVSSLTVTDQLRPYYLRERLLSVLSGYFGVLALLLAAIGIYGTTADFVGRRQREIGIRMALGADRIRIVRLVMGRVVLVTSAGIAAGVVLSLWTWRFIQSLLVNVSARDPMVLGGAAGVLVSVALVAGWLPVRRASRIDPAVTLREG
jgi:putative ABC transport system permease protein